MSIGLEPGGYGDTFDAQEEGNRKTGKPLRFHILRTFRLDPLVQGRPAVLPGESAVP